MTIPQLLCYLMQHTQSRNNRRTQKANAYDTSAPYTNSCTSIIFDQNRLGIKPILHLSFLRSFMAIVL